MAHMPNLVLKDESGIICDDVLLLLFLLVSQLVREGIESKVAYNQMCGCLTSVDNYCAIGLKQALS